jgi:hypothetical protein
MTRKAGSDNKSKLIDQSLAGDPEAHAAPVKILSVLIRVIITT